MHSEIFRAATAVEAVGPPPDGARGSVGRFSATVPPKWDVVGNTNGGYLQALAARAGSRAAEGRPPASVTTHYLSPVRPGPVLIDTVVHKRGNRFTTVSITVREAEGEERPLLQTIGSFGEAGVVDGIEHSLIEPPTIPSPDDCTPVPGGDLFPPPLMYQLELRVHPDDAAFTAGRLSFEGWVRLHGDEPITRLALLLFTDVFPPTAFNAQLPVAWAPTIELTTHVRGVPRQGWIQCRFSGHHVADGLMAEDGELWDETGRLVAQSRQLAMVPDAERGDAGAA
ncbi:MAG: thioesterase family protein [Actinomycetota bacterium]